MKIIAVGMNYAAHCKELHENEAMPKEPVIFMKSDASLLKNGNPFFLPDFSKRIEYETELVVRINRLGKCINAQFAHRYYDAVTVGIDFTARDLQQQFRDKGMPWELSKAFDNSAVVGDFVPLTEIGDVQALTFGLNINGNQVQCGHTENMIFKVDEIIAHVSQYMTLKVGDLIFTGTPAGVGPVAIGDRLEGYLEGKKLLDFYVR